MLLLIVLSIVFILIFSLTFVWISKKNKQDRQEEKMGILLTGTVSFILSSLLTAVAAFFLFMILGSTNVIDALFTLDMCNKDLMLMSIIYLTFILTLDNVFRIVFEMLTRHAFLIHFLMLWIRMVAFYLIGDFFQMEHYTNMLISGGVALLLTLMEFFYEWSKTKK